MEIKFFWITNLFDTWVINNCYILPGGRYSGLNV